MTSTVCSLRRLFISFIALLPIMFSSFSHAASPVLDRVLDRGVVKVAMTGDQPPFNMISRSGRFIGYDVDLAQSLANAMNVELEIVKVPFPELISAIEAGRADMIISGMSITSLRSKSVSFVEPYMMAGKSLVSTEERMMQLEQDGGFNRLGIKVAALSNSTSKTMVQLNMPKAEVVGISNYEEGLKLIRERKVDALFADMAMCKLAVLRNPSDNFVTLKKPLSMEPVAVAVPHGDLHFFNLVRNFMVSYDRVGLPDRLHAKWFENGEWLAQLP
ncbi:transporter substrate-binding domain-containing protein [Neiella marina]|uniref:Transporter substrate-binding domain-containing protein n=1 Tax=Neiella holothuriorum TaxID=2870530 RepID=A0ABS7ECZ6_9GAMM|nr:transporter substrate-binding domain-containing protein [Neiella holothuriorum]MBW8190125.1 transporter substrate-binding domain-containing protein [Neiella holothuriorum]